jgi:hypothetical protein
LTAGERLAAVQLDGHVAVDKLYAPLAADLEQLVLRHATRGPDGVLRLSLQARAAILRELDMRLNGIRSDLFGVVRETMKAAVSAAQLDVEPLPAGETATLASSGQAWLALATDRPSVMGQTAALLLHGVVGQLPASEVAKRVKQYFSPFFAPRRDAGGAILRDRQGAVRSWPGRAGMASQHVRLVMLSETTAAHGRTMRRLARRDGDLIRYTLSIRHLERDDCDANAKRDVGFGPGLYLPDSAPAVPAHPRCRCYYENGGKVPFPVEQMALTGLRRGFPIP